MERSPTTMVRICRARCRRHSCPCCGRLIGYAARGRMIDRLAELAQEYSTEGDIQLWTLTVDQKRYESPQAAWADVGAKRRIGETMRAMGILWYVVVLEWHESGWPHWHVMIWKPEARMRIDWSEMGRRWGLGYVLYRDRHRDASGKWLQNPKPMAWAVRYVTKYLTKGGAAPDWTLGLSHLRMIWGSRAWGPVVAAVPGVVDVADEEAAELPGDDEIGIGEAGSAHPWRTNGEAVAACGNSIRVLEETIDQRGEVRRRYLGASPFSWRIASKLLDRFTEAGRSWSAGASRLIPVEVWERVRSTLQPGGSGGVPRPLLT